MVDSKWSLILKRGLAPSTHLMSTFGCQEERKPVSVGWVKMFVLLHKVSFAEGEKKPWNCGLEFPAQAVDFMSPNLPHFCAGQEEACSAPREATRALSGQSTVGVTYSRILSPTLANWSTRNRVPPSP